MSRRRCDWIATRPLAWMLVALLSACGGKQVDARSSRGQKSSYHFGRVWEGQIVEHRFEFSNDSETVLLATGTRASCGCIASTFHPERLLPGQSGEFCVEFDTLGRQGGQRGYAVLETDHGDVRFTFTCDIDSWVKKVPATLEFGAVGRGEEANRSVSLLASDGSHLSVTSAKCPATLDWWSDVGEGKAVVEFRVIASGSLGQHRGEVVLGLDHEHQPRVRVPYVYTVVPRYIVAPQGTVSFGSMKRGEEASVTISVGPRREEDDTFRVIGATLGTVSDPATPPDAGRVVVNERAPDGLYCIEVVCSGLTQSYLMWKLVVETNDTDDPICSVDVIGVVTP